MAYLDSNFYYDAALRAIGQSTQQAQETGTAAINQGSQYIRDYLGQANAAMTPQVEASYGALDNYFDSLGIARPTAGSAAVAKATRMNSNLSQITTTLNKLKGLTNDQTVLSRINSALSTNDLAAQAATLKDITDPSKRGRRDWTTFDKTANDAISAIGQDAFDMLSTPEGQQQIQLANQLKNGTLEMKTASAADIYNKFSNTPGYQFALNEGINSVQNSAAAKGMLNSGRTMKGVADYATGLADQTYQNYVNNAANAAGMTAPFTQASAQGYLSAGQQLNQNQLGIADLNVNSALAYGSAASNLYAGRASQNWALENGLFGRQTTGSYPQLTAAP